MAQGEIFTVEYTKGFSAFKGPLANFFKIPLKLHKVVLALLPLGEDLDTLEAWPLSDDCLCLYWVNT